MGTTTSGTIICLLGPKGGVGRTTLAVNLATALASTCGRHVALVDLDFQFGDVALMLDVAPDRSIADVLPVMHKLDGDLLHSFVTVHRSGVGVLVAPAAPEQGERVLPEHVRQILRSLALSHDYVIVDLPSQLNDNVVASLDLADMIWLVASNNLASIKNTRLCLQMMHGWRYAPDRVKLVLNQTDNAAPGLDDAQAALDHPVFWKVPYDRRAVSSGQWGVPFVQGQPRAKVSRNITGLALALSGEAKPRRSFFRRVRR